MKEEKKEYTAEDLNQARWEGFEEATKRHVIILNYLLNKNSHCLPEGLDYIKAFEEIEDYEHYLWSE